MSLDKILKKEFLTFTVQEWLVIAIVAALALGLSQAPIDLFHG